MEEIYDHLCEAKTSAGHCTVRLDKYHARCPAHEVRVERKGSRKVEYCYASGVKVGDKVI